MLPKSAAGASGEVRPMPVLPAELMRRLAPALSRLEITATDVMALLDVDEAYINLLIENEVLQPLRPGAPLHAQTFGYGQFLHLYRDRVHSEELSALWAALENLPDVDTTVGA